MLKRLCQDQMKQCQDRSTLYCLPTEKFPKSQQDSVHLGLLYGRSVRGPAILKELWTKEVNIPKVMTSNEYVTELRECLEDSLKLTQEELQKSQKCYKKHYDKKAKPRCLKMGDQVLT